MLKVKKVKVRQHRKFVAGLPCACCGIENNSQSAHIKDKSGSRGADDFHIMPLCAPHLAPNGMVKGCHAEQHETSESEWWAKFGGVQRAKDFAVRLYENTGNEYACRMILEDFHEVYA